MAAASPPSEETAGKMRKTMSTMKRSGSFMNFSTSLLSLNSSAVVKEGMVQVRCHDKSWRTCRMLFTNKRLVMYDENGAVEEDIVLNDIYRVRRGRIEPFVENRASILSRWKEIFDRWDTNHSGTLDKAEMRAVFVELSMNCSDQYMDYLFSMIGDEDCEHFTFEQFAHFLEEASSNKSKYNLPGNMRSDLLSFIALNDVDTKVLEIITKKNSRCLGKSFEIKLDDPQACMEWMGVLKATITEANHVHIYVSKNQIGLLQEKIRLFYNHTAVQGFFVALILLNFLCNAIQSEVANSPGSHVSKLFDTFDLIFTIFFTLELVVNAFAHWFWPFITSGWNLFDIFIVAGSLLVFAVENLPGVNVLRMMRAFRVVRLFGRLKSLRLIINALIGSLIPVLNAFVILTLISAMYAILAVGFFGQQNPEHFSSFSLSLTSLFSIAAGMSDGWAFDYPGAIDSNGNQVPSLTGGLFFISFILVVGWILLQVVVAVLLDNFTSASEREKQKLLLERIEKNGRVKDIRSLDPLLSSLSIYDSQQELTRRIDTIFGIVDIKNVGCISRSELQAGVTLIPVYPTIKMSNQDVKEFFKSAGGGDETLALNREEFERAIRMQIFEFMQRHIFNAMQEEGPGWNSTVLFVLKSVLVQLQDNYLYDSRSSSSTTSSRMEDLPSMLEARMQQLEHNICERMEESLRAMQEKMQEELARLTGGEQKQKLRPAPRNNPLIAEIKNQLGVSSIFNGSQPTTSREEAKADPPPSTHQAAGAGSERLEHEVAAVRALLKTFYEEEAPSQLERVDELTASYRRAGGGAESFDSLNRLLQGKHGKTLGSFETLQQPQPAHLLPARDSTRKESRTSTLQLTARRGSTPGRSDGFLGSRSSSMRKLHQSFLPSYLDPSSLENSFNQVFNGFGFNSQARQSQ
ncbi:hypothetical protein GUITHDRAFT_98923 [Guillardia theta CCMP2712]|uniref:EF-hand domain-containing protein n=1 Tax=Guillardia theta (strain CCMP2712) TaxID=905079 RepID=L1K3U2_GUITC|nr:hypothetical protein GUITHDRAFT_98923 [Guillardia theta CCMP2712]EKX55140.1 hypothetical protein GUITHDRAFT_98923 [Guillardia theta CCMP2712]|eukprot:XP_005842120.1 hypothetical protein GUITHDRAFT_98923 [Guillardia theta CCMP2712]